MSEHKDIYTALNDVMQNVGYVQKQRGGRGINYTYAGEAALIQAIRPHMVEACIVVYPGEVRTITQDAYITANGAHMNRTTVVMAYRFVHAPSGSGFDVQVTGEGADVGDKSANKALTGAYKYALRQALMIETGDDPDDSPSEPARQSAAHKPQPTQKQRPPQNGQKAQTVADWRAKVEKGRNQTLGTLTSIAAAAFPFFSSPAEAFDALVLEFELPDGVNGFEWEKAQRLSNEGALRMFDWLAKWADRKATEDE